MMSMGLVFASMSMGLRLLNSSSFMEIRRASLPRALKAWELMIMALMALSEAKRSISVSWAEL